MSLRLEKSLRGSIKQLPKADLNIIINADITKLEDSDYITRQKSIPRKGVLRRLLIMAALTSILVISIYIWLPSGHSEYMMITIDINAGFVFTADSKGDILKVKGVDEAARDILRNVDYTDINVKDLTGALVSMSAKRHYLSDENHYILISVWDKEQDNSQKLLADISEQANIAAKAAKIEPVVLGQYLERSGPLERDAEHLGVTAGRLQLIDILLKYKPAYTTEQLVRYNIENLLKIAHSADITLPISGYRTVDVMSVSG